MNLASVSIAFDAQHFDPERDEGWHTHHWEVTVSRRSAPWTDGRDYTPILLKYRDAAFMTDEPWSPPKLLPYLWSCEALARHFLKVRGALEVEVRRAPQGDLPGFGARCFA